MPSAIPQLKIRLLISSHEYLLALQVSEGDSSRAATAATEDRSVTIADRLEQNEIRYQENLQPSILESASATPQLKTRLLISSHENLLVLQVSD